jgi:mono/diheme cytochrome c family protein
MERERGARGLALIAGLLALLVTPLPRRVDAADTARKACVGGCKAFQQSCLELARARFDADRPACTGDGAARPGCRKAVKQRFRGNAKQCKAFGRKSCKACCRAGEMTRCAPSAGYPLPAEPQEPGDPARGRDLLLNGSYMTCGIPAKLWNHPLLGALARPGIAAGFGGSLDAPTIPDRNEKNAAMPYFLNVFTADNGAEVINANCLMCHGGVFDGELVVGLGNAAADFTAGAGGGAAGLFRCDGPLIDQLGLSAAEKDQMCRIASRGAVLEPLTKMRTVGHNPAELFAVILMVHHDRETLAWSDEEVIPYVVRDHAGAPIEEPLLTSDPPPWWRVHKKHALFYNGMARGDHRGTMALATSVCVDDLERARQVDAWFKDIQAYVNSIRAPAYRRAIDTELAARGRELFLRDCAWCHGTYGEREEDDTYPNLLIPLGLVGTDPVVAEAGVVHSPELVDWYNGSFYGQVTRMEPNDPFPGYMPPPLDGIWATAPYLHNGSVPTVALVLSSQARPACWKRIDFDTTHFDEEALGWPYAEVSCPDAAPEAERKFIYDATKWSQSNAGHTFGDHLAPAERRAVIEYLKTL